MKHNLTGVTVGTSSEKKILSINPRVILIMTSDSPVEVSGHEVAIGVGFALLTCGEFDARERVENGRILLHSDEVAESLVGDDVINVGEQQPR